MNQLEILQWFTQLQHPLLNSFARVLTFLGNEEFYFLILPLVYWCFSKQVGFRLFYTFIFSMYVNSFLKINFAVTRPVGSEGIKSLFVDSAEVGSHYPHDSFPSGHAQGSTTLWGYLAYKTRSLAFLIIAIFLIFFISISRLYSGLHWPTDIIVGIGLGTAIILISLLFERILSTLSGRFQAVLAIIIPIILLVGFQEEEGFKFAGMLLGAGIGYLLEAKYVKMEISYSYLRRAIAFVVGIVGMLAIQVGLEGIFPDAFLFDFIRYGLIGLWGLYLAPLVFIILRIYDKDERIFPMFTSRM